MVIEDHTDEGIEVYVFNNRVAAKRCFNEIIQDYRDLIEFGINTEIDDTSTTITDEFKNEVARVLLQEKIIN